MLAAALYAFLPGAVADTAIAWIIVGIGAYAAYNATAQFLAAYTALLNGIASNALGSSGGGAGGKGGITSAGGGGVDHGGGTGTPNPEFSPYTIKTGQMVAREQRWGTAGRGVVESWPYGTYPQWRTGPITGRKGAGNHAEDKVIKSIENDELIPLINTEKWHGSLVISVITTVYPCYGQYEDGADCQLNFRTRWGPELRNLAAAGGINIVAFRDLYWPGNFADKNEPALWWAY